jgi:hypothetical protein
MKVTLEDVEPWAQWHLHVPSTFTVEQFRETMHIAMGWPGSDPWEFQAPNGNRFGTTTGGVDTKLSQLDLQPMQWLNYESGGYRHSIQLDRVGYQLSDRVPRLTGAQRVHPMAQSTKPVNIDETNNELRARFPLGTRLAG